ncbi:hypothetical protein LEP1GSC192_3659 [Leptospira sp. B5-022]|nr:hypothetical protein LEP1GSC192_3659 [Leptospira sp. B5-022]
MYFVSNHRKQNLFLLFPMSTEKFSKGKDFIDTESHYWKIWI